MKRIAILLPLLFVLCQALKPTRAAPAPGSVYLPLLHFAPRGWQWEAAGEPLLQPAPLNIVTAVDEQGRFHVIWDTLLAPRFLYHTVWENGAWQTPVAIGNPLGISTLLGPPLAAGEGGLDLVWHNDLGLGVPLSQRILYAHFDGGAWQAVEEIYRVPGTAGGRIEAWLAPSSPGSLGAVVRDDGFVARVFQLRRTPEGWLQSAAIEPGHPVSVLWPDQSGGIHFYGNTLPDQLRYSYWRDGAFVQQGSAGEGTVMARQTQPDGQNNLHLLWLGTVSVPGDTVTGLYSQCLAPGLQWQPLQIVSGDQRVLRLPVTAAGEEALVAASWEEAEVAQIYLGLWRGCVRQPAVLVPELDPDAWAVRSLALRESAGRLCLLAHPLAGGSRYRAMCARLPAG